MASFHAAEKFFFNPRLRIDAPPAAGSALIPQHGRVTGHDCLLGEGTPWKPKPRDRRGSIRNLRKVVKGKGIKSYDHLPQIDPYGAFESVKRTSLKKSESVSVLDSLPVVRPNITKVPRLYRSHPSLGGKPAMDNTQQDMDPKSLPAGLQYCGSSTDTKNMLPDDKVGKLSTILPSITRGQIKMADGLLLGDDGINDEDYAVDGSENGSDHENKPDVENEITKMLEEHKQEAVMAERDVQSDWVLQNEIDSMQKKFERRKKKLIIQIADEDPMVVIQKRIMEVKQMTRPKRDQRQVLERFTPEVQNLILRYKDIPVSEIRERRGKTELRLLNRFRRAVGLTLLLLRGFHGSSRYYIDSANVSELRKRMEKMVEKSNNVATGRASITSEMQLALSTQPHLRDRKQIKQILWMLRATRAFKHLFPAEMETEVARMVAYERYDDGRIIAYQSRTPDRFYYILSGRVNLLRQYKLSTGQVTKSMGFLTKGSSSDPQEVDRQWMREDSWICKGQVEVLLFDKKPFRTLQHTTDGPPLDFLQSLHLFLEFPVKRFLSTPDAIDVRYFGQGRIVVKDSNRTPWIHVVKSGFVKVVRRQSVIDVRLSNESKFTAPTADHLGCGKAFSHAEAMLGIQAKQKKLKSLQQTPLLPQIDSTTGVSYNPFVATIGVDRPVIFRHSPSVSSSGSTQGKDVDFDVVVEVANGTYDQSSMKPYTNSVEKSEDYEPHDLWLTREKTGHDTIFPTIKKKETPKRRAYLQLDLLRPGDVFGLDHLQQPLASEPVGVSLLSDGAEVIKISKRFFLQNAENNTMLKVETMYKEYLTEDEAKDIIYHKETWDQYKAALWGRMTAPSPIPSVSKR